MGYDIILMISLKYYVCLWSCCFPICLAIDLVISKYGRTYVFFVGNHAENYNCEL